jgi:general nucleoside transport system permease protein
VNRFFTAAVLSTTLASGVRLSTPFLLASLGETMGQRSGVLNLGVDGVMLVGAFGAYYTTLKTGNVWFGIGLAIAVGLVMGLIVAVVNVTWKAQQGISGIGIYLFGLGLSGLLFEKLVGTPLPIKSLPVIHIPLLQSIPVVGKALFRQDALVYFAFLLVPILTIVLNRTTFGLKVRAAGESPEAVDSMGVGVSKIRYSTVLIGNVLAALAGAALAIALGIFQLNLTNGEGFIAVALVYFGAWRPLGVAAGALLYGLVNATVVEWKTLKIIPLSASDLANMAPAVLTILILVLVARRFREPAALGVPFERGG